MYIVRIGTIPELGIIPTTSADYGIVPDNSRIVQGISYGFLHHVLELIRRFK